MVPLPIPTPDRPAGLILPGERKLPPAGRALVQCLRAFVTDIAERGVADIAGSYSAPETINMTRAGDRE